MTFQETDAEKKLRHSILQKRTPLIAIAKTGNVSSTDLLRWWNKSANLPPTTDFLEIFKSLQVRQSHEEHNTEFIRSPNTISCNDTVIELPARYKDTPLSYISTSKHILEFIRLQFGQEKHLNTLLKLGVRQEYFQNIENKINIKFFEDLLKEYSILCSGKPNLNMLSRALFLTVEESSLSNNFTPTSSYREAYEQIEASLSRFDQNFEYKFQIGQLGAEIITKPSAQLADAVKNEKYGSYELYQYRSHLFGNMVNLCGLQPLQIEVSRCISAGDSFCKYVARYN